jgi:hypothetical protein
LRKARRCRREEQRLVDALDAQLPAEVDHVDGHDGAVDE